MTQLAVLFPGQGAQFVGMAADLADRSTEAKQLFERANDRLGLDLWKLMQEGPEEQLNTTAMSQPAIFVASLAAIEALKAEGGDARLAGATTTAGLSLGEYSALVFAGAMEFEVALEIVTWRGKFMQEACDEVDSGMSSILGLDFDQVRELIPAASEAGRIGIGNVNAARQIVVSGEHAALARMEELAKEAGAKRVVPLKVAGAYHSVLMASTSEKLQPYLAQAEIRAPRIEFYSNVTGRPEADPERIRSGLLAQVESSVLWAPTLEAMVASGVSEFVEVGPGRVLAGLLRQVERRLPIASVLDRDSAAAFLGEG